MIKISVAIITGNEERNIRRCLESVKWADEIIVVDSESKDKTVEIVKGYTDKIFVEKWQGYAKQKWNTVSKTKNDWVLSLDADEEITPELKNEIENLIINNKNGFKIPRKNYFLKKEIKGCGWGNDFQLRLFNKTKTNISNVVVHESFQVEGEIGILKNPIKHFTHPDLETALQKTILYSKLEAEAWNKNKKISGITILLHTFSAFFRPYFSLKGYKDGVHGLIISLLDAVCTMMKYIRLWEKQQKLN